MTEPTHRGPAPRRANSRLLVAVLAMFAAPIAACSVAAQSADSTAIPTPAEVAPTTADTARVADRPPDSNRVIDPDDEDRRHRLAVVGLENISAEPGDEWLIAYENRRYRHSAFARGRALAALRVHAAGDTVYERRLDMIAAAIRDTGGATPAFVRYPSDAEYRAPRFTTRESNRTRRSVDLELRPLFTYDLGRVLDPVLIRFEVSPALRWNPWPGGRATLSVILPVRNDYSPDALQPDLNQVRPGPMTLEQFAWLPRMALVSATAGIFGDDRYGISVGAARPFAGGALLLDAQADLTGFLAFGPGEVQYSPADHVTGFGGLTWRPPALDLALRARAARFLYGDHGVELELRRAMGDLEIAFFGQVSGEFKVSGVRIVVPLPPWTRPTGAPIRVVPTERVALDYRDAAQPVGRFLRSVASREDFLRQLSAPGLAANADRYDAGRGHPRERAPHPDPEWVSLTGMTGFINTPWCGVIGDRELEIGYNAIPRAAAYDHRGLNRNELYYAALGFLPHFEAGLRWTVIPGLHAFQDLVPESRLTDADRMLSGRIELWRPRPNRPGLAVGIEDAAGTRRFHSTYAVAGIPLQYLALRGRVSMGYAPRVFTASRHTLDGPFGAVEWEPRRPVAVALEYDTEKWNTSLGIDLGLGFRARAALLDGRHVSVGGGWFHPL